MKIINLYGHNGTSGAGQNLASITFKRKFMEIETQTDFWKLLIRDNTPEGIESAWDKIRGGNRYDIISLVNYIRTGFLEY